MPASPDAVPLPASSPPPTQAHPGVAVPLSAFHDEPINILIVDAEPENLAVLENILDDRGYRLIRATSAEQARLALGMEEFALAILDTRMPGTTGIELAQMIQERHKTARVPILFLTEYYNDDLHVLEGCGAGAADYLHKPVNPAILRAKVAVFAELHRKCREAGMATRALLAEVAERRRTEDLLRELNTTLDQRVTDRTAERRQAETALRASEERLRLAMDAAQMGSWDWNMKTDEILWTPQHETLFGYEPGTPRRSYAHFRDRLHPCDRERVEATVQDCLARRADFLCEFRVVWPDGSIHWMSGFGRFHFDPEGRPVRMLGMVEDITARKDVEELACLSADFARGQWAEAEAALEALPANIAILDASGVIVRVNTAWSSFAHESGLALGAVGVGVDYLAVCAAVTGAEAGQAASFAAGIRSVLSGESGRFSMEYPCHSPQEQRWFMGYVTVTIGAGPARAVVAHVDVTAQKRIEERVRILNQELEHRVAGRTAELQAAVATLETEIAGRHRLQAEVLRITEMERRRMAADLHDGICQELAGIQIYTHILRQKLEEARHPLAPAAAHIEDAIVQTTNDTRQLARGMDPVVGDGSGLMHALRELARTTARLHRVRCSFECAEPVSIENPTAANELYRIAQEAIHNALTHGHAKRITVRLCETGSESCLAVTDNGGGLPADLSTAPGMGLRVMHYRAGLIGGRIVIQARRRGGVEVICTVAKT